MFKPFFTIRKLSIGVLLLIVVWQWSQAGLITGKAYLAKWLIAHAWQQTLATGENKKPWPWADTWPVAKITFNNNKHFYILAGGAGNSLAFGPGHLSNTALPGTRGASVIGGHRDTHFSLLKNSNENHIIYVQNKMGATNTYRIKESWIVDSKNKMLAIDQNDNSLYLVTCYPFNALTVGRDERLVVRAELARGSHKVGSD